MKLLVILLVALNLGYFGYVMMVEQGMLPAVHPLVLTPTTAVYDPNASLLP